MSDLEKAQQRWRQALRDGRMQLAPPGPLSPPLPPQFESDPVAFATILGMDALRLARTGTTKRFTPGEIAAAFAIMAMNAEKAN